MVRPQNNKKKIQSVSTPTLESRLSFKDAAKA